MRAVSDSLIVNEIYLSLQGESSFAGLPCIFIRLTGCDLRCSYCDTAYAFTQGGKMALDNIESRIAELAAPFHASSTHGRLPLIELTGGEPMLQKNTPQLMQRLCDTGYTVLIETSGAHDLSQVDPRVRRIMDLKCPSSGECDRNRWENLTALQPTDEIKFVIGTREDYDWMKGVIAERELASICQILCSWVAPLLEHQRDKSLKPLPPDHTPIARKELAEAIANDALPVRFQLQLHKHVWPPDERGV
ncbi:MAG: radical SAM protein [Verrucomicrobiia bacterium]|jgi:7-carboxy-7-deazaguanine synthase